jgi:Tfp pilus assembly protein PilN
MPFTTLLILWGVITAALVVLLIYRSTLSMHQEDQLFLGESESHMEKEQALVLSRLERLQWPLRLLGGASGVLILLIFGLWVWEGFART